MSPMSDNRSGPSLQLYVEQTHQTTQIRVGDLATISKITKFIFVCFGKFWVLSIVERIPTDAVLIAVGTSSKCKEW